MIRHNNIFRPWSSLDRALKRPAEGGWAFLGTVAMETRSNFALLKAKNHLDFRKIKLLRFRDGESRFLERAEKLTDQNQNLLKQAGISEDVVDRHLLLGSFSAIAQSITDYLNNCNERNLIIDITSMPKMTFFFAIRQALRCKTGFQNILVTYTEPEGYTDEPLAENPERWNTLPGFDAPLKLPEDRKVIISIGYEPLGLPDLVVSGEFEGARTYLLFPFPAPPVRIRKNWKFARDLYPNIPQGAVEFDRVDGINVPEVFDSLCRIGEFGSTQVTLAPFGPKPMSLAMALYATKYSSGPCQTSVYYTQPTSYNPDYSHGVKIVDGLPSSNCYPIRLQGKDLY